MNDTLKKYLFCILFLGLLPQLAFGQLDDEYFTADKLLQQQEYEKAYEKFYDLHQEHPNTYIFLDKLVECLINLKEYEKAISITQNAANKGDLRAQALIRLGEIYHTSGDTEKAFKTWDELLKSYTGNQQLYLKVARAMKDRKAYNQAVDVYRQIRENSSGSNIITSELAETYLQAGKYENAIQEFLELVSNDPNRMNFVQRHLMRSRDDNVYDIAILEISDFLDDLSPSHPSYQQLQQLEIWLLMERKLFERALVTAQNFEAQSSTITYSLYNLGSKLLAEQEFELAEKAYYYYIDNNVPQLKDRSKEELAKVYIQWAEYLENYNLGLSAKRSELYQKAFSVLESLQNQSPNYQRMAQVLMTLSELSLDILHKPEKASEYLEKLRLLSDNSMQIAQQNYIEGRLHLYDEKYTQARVSFSKSNNQERIGSLAEKTRYYLALTDFFSGDYEFAKIQLNALKRQNTSYFANDAVQLNLWIQNGLQADSSGTKLQPFAKAVEHFSRGEDQLGINKLKTLFEKDRYNPLIDEALLELSTYKDPQNVGFVYRALSTFLKQQGQASPLYERLLWEKARLADQFVTNKEIATPVQQLSTDSLSAAEQFFKDSEVSIPTNIEELVSLYEEILLHFPNGFYSTYVRDRIQELQQPQT
jgi:tetratricopeptide (TPR) repeat protein